MEWVVYPELDQRQKDHALQWTREPWRALQSHDSSGFQYGAWLLAASIEESLDSNEWHNELWDSFLGRDELDVIDDLDSVLAGSDSSFATEYGLFIERAATMDFDLGEDLETPAEVWDANEGGLVASHAASELPVDAIILATSSPPAPQTLGTSYVRVDAPGAAQALRIDIETLPDTTGSSRGFELRLIAVEEGEAGLTHRLDLAPKVGSGGTEAGSILLDSFGGSYQSLIIAASPTLPSTDGSNASWSYSLSLTEALGGVGFVAGETVPGGGSGCESCSQVSAGPAPSRARLPLTLLGLSLLLARRREGSHGRL
jgi:MYXO-CTERM domain-containing protein